MLIIINIIFFLKNKSGGSFSLMENIASSKQCTCRSRASSFSHSVRVFDQSQPHHHRPPALIRTLTHLGIHQEIIKVPLRLPLLLSFHLSHQHSFSLFTSCFPMQDRVRTETYREAIMQSFIAGKVIFLFPLFYAATCYHCNLIHIFSPFFYILCKSSFLFLQITMYFMN